jgi:hypothetical protein
MKGILICASMLFYFYGCRAVNPPEVKSISTVGIEQSPSLLKDEPVLKRKVAIARFSNETKYGQGWFYDKNEDRLGKQA